MWLNELHLLLSNTQSTSKNRRDGLPTSSSEKGTAAPLSVPTSPSSIKVSSHKSRLLINCWCLRALRRAANKAAHCYQTAAIQGAKQRSKKSWLNVNYDTATQSKVICNSLNKAAEGSHKPDSCSLLQVRRSSTLQLRGPQRLFLQLLGPATPWEAGAAAASAPGTDPREIIAPALSLGCTP